MKRYLFVVVFALFSFTLFAENLTIGAFRQMDQRDKIECVEGYSSCAYQNVVTDSFYGQKEIKQALLNPQVKKAFYLAKEYMEENTDFEVGPFYGQASVGEAYIHFLDLMFIGSKLTGISIGYILDGCDHVDENGDYEERGSSYYSSFEEAKKVDCIETDVQWQGHGNFEVFTSRVSPLDVDSYLDWSGY